MNTQTFNKLLEARQRAIEETLKSKAVEYATDDRLHNFKKAAKTFSCLPTQACWSYMMKHLVSIKDMADGTKLATR